MTALQFLRSLVFNIQIYVAMFVLAIVFLPWALVSPRGARTACKSFCRWTLWTASWMIGLRTELRGRVPTGDVVIAAKHQSFLDIIIIFNAVPRAKFIMKRELLFAPVLGQYAYRIGCIPVDRGRRGQAIAKMLADVDRGRIAAGQLIIYPQGTRIAPGVQAPYKIGSHLIYRQLQQPCVPAATNVGIFWGKRGIMRRPGTAIVEFLEPIEPGLDKAEFLLRLQSEIETASDRLMAEGGFRLATTERLSP